MSVITGSRYNLKSGLINSHADFVIITCLMTPAFLATHQSQMNAAILPVTPMPQIYPLAYYTHYFIPVFARSSWIFRHPVQTML